MKKLAVAVVLNLLAFGFANSAMAETIAQMEGSAGTGTITTNPVISAILCQPGVVNGKTYSNWSFLINDGTGSMDVYGTMPGGYTPVVGNTVSVSGTYSPYHQIPEMGTVTAISATGAAAVPAPVGTTIPIINVSTLPSSVAGYMLELDGVTISGISGNFDGSNLQGTITDGSHNSMTLYYWPTSYSVENANLTGPIPTGRVNMTGFVSVYGTPGTAEFTPMTIGTAAPVPEPGTMVLLASGLAAAAIMFLRRKASK
jgi:hypothetical protein